MARADFIHKTTRYSGRQVLVIEDLNLGNMSVTNNIEQVLDDIAIMEKIDPRDYMVVYKDSEGCWDGWDAAREVFVHLNEDSWRSAVQKYVNKQVEGVYEL